MYVAQNLVYLQMQKTGSTHVTSVLKKYNKGKAREKHGQMTDYDKYRDRPIISSVRNPWDWYVSLWAYGCRGSGGLFKYLTQLPLSEVRHAVRHRSLGASAQSILRIASQAGRRPDWKALYADPANEANFRAWLKLMLGTEGRFISKEGYSASPVKSVIGFMTYRFLALNTEYRQWNAVGRSLHAYDDVAAFTDTHSVATRVLKMESLNDDLHDILQSVGVNVSLEDLEAIGKTNTSTHRTYADYYDDETHRLVATRDRLIIDRYGYQMF